MNSFASSHRPLAQNSSAASYPTPPLDIDPRRLFTSALSLLDQPPPPSLREIISAYRTKGDGDRDLLLSMLNAKAAEDQRIAAMATLQRTTLEIYHASIADGHHVPLQTINGHAYTSPHSPSSHQYDQKPSHPPHSRHRSISRSSSPPGPRLHIPPIRDTSKPDTASDHPRKRPRMSHAPPLGKLNDPHAGPEPDQLPPSPYSSSSRSDSAECSPRSRASMAIGSLLSSGPQHTVTTTEPRGQEHS